METNNKSDRDTSIWNRYFKIVFLDLLICESLVNGRLLNALTLLEDGGLLLSSGHESLQGHAA